MARAARCPIDNGCSRVSVPATVLDCAPLETTSTATLSDGDLRRIEPVQQVLLRPTDYDSIDGWRAAVNRALVTAFDADAAMFQLRSPGLVLHYSDELPVEQLSTYRELMPDFEQSMHIYQRSLRLGAGNRHMIWKHHLRWFYESDYYNELIRGMRAFDTTWLSAPAAGSRYPAMLHIYHDHPSRGARFGARDVQLLRVLRPALETGARLALSAITSRASLTATLDAQQAGIIVYSLTGEMLHGNASVARIARTRRGERVILQAARELALGLAVPDPLALGDPASGSRRVATRVTEYELSAVRLGEGVFGLHPVVLVTVNAVEPSLPRRKVLRERFGLTARQAEVAILLAGRRTNPEIADMLCISQHTARRHTEAVLGKLSVRDRRDVADVLRGTHSPAPTD